MVKVNEYDFPDELYYSVDHTWLKIEDGKVRIGLDDLGQKLAGKILYVRLPPKGRPVRQGRTLAMIESGKWVGPVKSPASGKIVEVNEKILNNPKLINSDPYGEGWIALIEPTNLEGELANLIHGPEKVEGWIKRELEKWAEKLA